MASVIFPDTRPGRQMMTDAGFRNNPGEWWHCNLIADPFPGTYFDFPVQK